MLDVSFILAPSSSTQVGFQVFQVPSRLASCVVLRLAGLLFVRARARAVCRLPVWALGALGRWVGAVAPAAGCWPRALLGAGREARWGGGQTSGEVASKKKS
jgi:hypothetical protein